jgi:hypothetical protein
MGNYFPLINNERYVSCHPMADGSTRGGYYGTVCRVSLEVQWCLRPEVRVGKTEDVL